MSSAKKQLFLLFILFILGEKNILYKVVVCVQASLGGFLHVHLLMRAVRTLTASC